MYRFTVVFVALLRGVCVYMYIDFVLDVSCDTLPAVLCSVFYIVVVSYSTKVHGMTWMSGAGSGCLVLD